MLRQVREPVLVGCMLAGLGTSTAYALPQDPDWQLQRSARQTTSGAPVAVAHLGGSAIGELRRLSGLTWEQLARVFNVSRRSLHFWASGKPMAPSNEEHLQRILAVVRKIDRGSASRNRTALFGVLEDGVIPVDLLTTGDYERVVMLLGHGEARRVSPSRPSAAEREAREPPLPENLVGALQDRIHPTSGRLLAAQPIKTVRRT